MIGSRCRKYINVLGEVIILSIRRLRCVHCRRVHHELPDILIPYKRYGSDSIEAVITSGKSVAVSADESTLYRWEGWFNHLITYILGCLQSISIRLRMECIVEDKSHLTYSLLQRVWHFVGDASGWLARVVRPLANLNLWVHTRSAFLS